MSFSYKRLGQDITWCHQAVGILHSTLPSGCSTAWDLVQALQLQEPGPPPQSLTAGLVSCLTLISEKAMPVSEFPSWRTGSSWKLFVVAASHGIESPALAGFLASSTRGRRHSQRGPGPGPGRFTHTRCFTTSVLFCISLLATFLLLFDIASSSKSTSVRLLWLVNTMPVSSGTLSSMVCF